MVIQYLTQMRGLSCFFLFILIQVSSGTETVTGFIGHNVTLPCYNKMKSHDSPTFCWGRAQVPLSKCSSTIFTSQGEAESFRQSTRYQILGQVSEGDFSLTILNAQRSDAGVYGCRIEIPGLFNDLKVNIDLIMEEAPVKQPVTVNGALYCTERNEMLTPTPESAKMEEIQSETNQVKLSLETCLEVGNIGRMATIFFLTIIVILVILVRRSIKKDTDLNTHLMLSMVTTDDFRNSSRERGLQKQMPVQH